MSTCEKCKHAFTMQSPDGKQSNMVCRRYPPQLIAMPIQVPTMGPGGAIQMQHAIVPQAFPPAIKADWSCGEFSAALVS